MLNLEAETRRLRGVNAFATLDLLQSCWHYPLAEKARELYNYHAEGNVYAYERSARKSERYDIL